MQNKNRGRYAKNHRAFPHSEKSYGSSHKQVVNILQIDNRDKKRKGGLERGG